MTIKAYFSVVTFLAVFLTAAMLPGSARAQCGFNAVHDWVCPAQGAGGIRAPAAAPVMPFTAPPPAARPTAPVNNAGIAAAAALREAAQQEDAALAQCYNQSIAGSGSFGIEECNQAVSCMVAAGYSSYQDTNCGDIVIAAVAPPPLCIDTAGLTRVEVSTQAELEAALANASCGSEIVLLGNHYNGFSIDKQCGSGNPIVIRNEGNTTPRITEGSINISGSSIYLSGMYIRQVPITLAGNDLRITRSVIEGSGATAITANGANISIDHNEIYDYGQGVYVCATMACGGAEANQGTYIGYNYFHDQSGSGSQTIMVSADSWGSSQVTIENNLIENANSDGIAIYTSNNVISGNTIVNSGGGLLIATGGSNLVEGNSIVNSHGIRVHSDNNVVNNNSVTAGSGIVIGEGGLTLDDVNPSCPSGDMVPAVMLPDGSCQYDFPAARNTVVTNNYADINVGCFTNGTYTVPAENSQLSDNQGTVTLCLEAGTNDADGGQVGTPALPEPVQRTPDDTGYQSDTAGCQ